MYGKGISKSGDLLDCAVDGKIIEKAGSWYSLDGERIGQGRENVKEYLEANPDVMAMVEQRLRDNLQAEREKARRSNAPDQGADEMPDGLRVDADGVVIE